MGYVEEIVGYLSVRLPGVLFPCRHLCRRVVGKNADGSILKVRMLHVHVHVCTCKWCYYVYSRIFIQGKP